MIYKLLKRLPILNKVAKKFRSFSKELKDLRSQFRDLREEVNEELSQIDANRNILAVEIAELTANLSSREGQENKTLDAVRRLSARIDALATVMQELNKEQIQELVDRQANLESLSGTRSSMTLQESAWEGSHGFKYVIHHLPEDWRATRIEKWKTILSRTSEVESVFEVGCNIGANLNALRLLLPDAFLSGIEANSYAAYEASKIKNSYVYSGSTSEISKINRKFDLVFSRGVLIHINPDLIDDLLKEMILMSGKYLLIWENFSPIILPHSKYNSKVNKARDTESISYQHWDDFAERAKKISESIGREISLIGRSFNDKSEVGSGQLVWTLFEFSRD